jgi:phosphoglucomutase
MRFDSIVKKAEQGINDYLTNALKDENIDKQSYDIAKQNTLSNISKWLSDAIIEKLSPNSKYGIIEAIEQNKWEDLVNAFRKSLSFGTGGIRGLMANNKDSIIKLKENGIDAKILKGPNTLNNIVLLQTSAGVAKFGRGKGFNKIVIGYDSRIRGFDLAKAISELFLGYDFTVYLFDAPCPYPEVTFAIPYKDIKADIGILISASHNDYRYNGYKLSCGNGSQFDPKQRDEMYNDYILNATFDDIKLLKIKDAPEDKIYFLGGDKPLDDFDYLDHEDKIIDIHGAHREHVKTFLLQPQNHEKSLQTAYCAFHGAGRIAVPRLLKEIGFNNIRIITKNGLNELNGLFPSFNNEPGREQQPDPGDPRAAKIIVDSFKEEYPGEWDQTDILIGTDPDADRCGVVVKVPDDQNFLYHDHDYMLMPADDMWAILIWYRLKFDKSIDPEKTFIVLSHTTSESIVKLALKHGLGIIKTWVGFAALSAGVRDAWEHKIATNLFEGRKDPSQEFCDPFIQETINMSKGKRTYNLGAMEQSNGFSILGFPPDDAFSLGKKGHVRDKDGTFAAVLMAEVADWAKQNGTTLFELVDRHIYCDPDIGLYVNHYEPDPLDGEYPGIQGDRIKKSIIKRALDLYQSAMAGNLEIGGLPVQNAAIYRTGKYDHIYVPTPDFHFPDEGIRFYFDSERLNHLTIRPSGTTNSLRFHVQMHSSVDENNLIEKKQELRQKTRTIADHIRELVQAPRSSELE